MNFVHFWSRNASLARFCVIKTFSAAQFVNAIGIVGAERLSNLRRQLRIDAWPAAVLVVHEQNNKPQTGPTHFAAYPFNFPATRQAVSLGAPLGRHASRRSPGIKSHHLTWSTHGTPTLPAKFAEEDVAPHLHEDECWSATRGAEGMRSARGKRRCHKKLWVDE